PHSLKFSNRSLFAVVAHLLPSALSEISDTANHAQLCRCPSLAITSSLATVAAAPICHSVTAHISIIAAASSASRCFPPHQLSVAHVITVLPCCQCARCSSPSPPTAHIAIVAVATAFFSTRTSSDVAPLSLPSLLLTSSFPCSLSSLSLLAADVAASPTTFICRRHH
ncbi:hypothetical protein BHE74_00030545, partial [Ensete ventricosum]